MDVTKNYATRLDKISRNFKNAESISFLVESYPDHGFVIDINEAKTIFNEVHPFTPEMITLEKRLAILAREPIDWSMGTDGEPYEIRILSTPPQEPAVQQPEKSVEQPLNGPSTTVQQSSVEQGNSEVSDGNPKVSS